MRRSIRGYAMPELRGEDTMSTTHETLSKPLTRRVVLRNAGLSLIWLSVGLQAACAPAPSAAPTLAPTAPAAKPTSPPAAQPTTPPAAAAKPTTAAAPAAATTTG